MLTSDADGMMPASLTTSNDIERNPTVFPSVVSECS